MTVPIQNQTMIDASKMALFGRSPMRNAVRATM